MLTADPSNRFSAAQCLQHDFFKNHLTDKILIFENDIVSSLIDINLEEDESGNLSNQIE
jgi:hypothetical protein